MLDALARGPSAMADGPSPRVDMVLVNRLTAMVALRLALER